MKVLETVKLKSLKEGDFFSFKGRFQTYWCIGSFADGSVHYQSTFSGRRYVSNYWDNSSNKLVEIFQYGNF